MKFFLVLALGLLASSLNGVVYAEQTTIRQRILPADCIFDVIDIGGVQQFNFYTPEACGVAIPDPPVIDPDAVPEDSESDDLLSTLRRGGQITVTQVVTDKNENITTVNKDTNIDISNSPLSQEVAETTGGISLVKTIAIIGGVLFTVGAMAYTGVLLLAKNGFILFGDDPDIKDDNQPKQ